MGKKVIGHRADGVFGAVVQVDVAVVVKVHRPARPAGGHELAQAPGAGVAAARLEGVGAAALRHAQKLLQLAAKVGTALGRARVGVWKIKGQCGQRVQHADVAHVAAVQRFHANDADDDFCRHAIFALGARQRRPVLLPKAHTCTHPHFVDKTRAVGLPVLGGAARRRQHQARHLWQKARLAEGAAQPVGVQATALCHVVGKGHHIGPAGVVAGGRRGAGGGSTGGLGAQLFRVFLGCSADAQCASSYKNKSVPCGARTAWLCRACRAGGCKGQGGVGERRGRKNHGHGAHCRYWIAGAGRLQRFLAVLPKQRSVQCACQLAWAHLLLPDRGRSKARQPRQCEAALVAGWPGAGRFLLRRAVGQGRRRAARRSWRNCAARLDALGAAGA